MPRPRLSQRLAGAKPDGPHEGMPEHIFHGVEHWFGNVCGYRGGGMDAVRIHQVAAQMGVAVGNHAPSAMQALISRAEGDPTFCIDLIDATLDVWTPGANRWGEINGLLASGASVWTVNETRDGLTRVVSDEAQATFDSATSVADEITTEMKEAWANAFGRNGDPSDAWDHAIKAMEALLIRVVVPNQTKPNLGHVIGELRNNGHVWKMILPGKDDDNDVAPLVGILSGIWPNTDRHGGGQNTRPPTPEEARAVVTLAATVVQWHRDGWVVQRR